MDGDPAKAMATVEMPPLRPLPVERGIRSVPADKESKWAAKSDAQFISTRQR